MGNQTSTTPQMYRQRSSVALAGVCAVTGVLLLLSLVRNWSDYPRPLFAAWLVFGLAVAWAVFVRPAVLLDAEGVTLRNIVRDVHIPWAQLTHVESRWNLKVFAGDHGYTAWAISSQPERPKRAASGGAVFGMSVPGRSELASSAASRPSMTVPKVNARSVARLIRMAKQEYDEAVTFGQSPATSEASVKVAWVPLVLAMLLVPAVAVVVLSLT